MHLSVKTLSIFLKELAVEWNSGAQNYIPLKQLRLRCPCAGCSGEKDVLGNVYKGLSSKHNDLSFQVSHYETVGLYGIRFFWKDGHHDGIYTFKLLYSLNEEIK
mgnify:CR=1 FL=1